jgi:hypothetical protein
MKKHGGKYPGPLDFIKTMSGIKLDALRGPLHLDDRLTVVQNIYIKKVEKKKMFGYDKDELWNTVIKTYPNVVPQAAGLQPRLPALPILRIGRQPTVAAVHDADARWSGRLKMMHSSMT